MEAAFFYIVIVHGATTLQRSQYIDRVGQLREVIASEVKLHPRICGIR